MCIRDRRVARAGFRGRAPVLLSGLDAVGQETSRHCVDRPCERQTIVTAKQVIADEEEDAAGEEDEIRAARRRLSPNSSANPAH